MDTVSYITWVNNVTGKVQEIKLTGLCYDRQEIIDALDAGAVCILDSANNLLMTCFDVARVERVQSAGDLVIWPNGLAYRVINSANT